MTKAYPGIRELSAMLVSLRSVTLLSITDTDVDLVSTTTG